MKRLYAVATRRGRVFPESVSRFSMQAWARMMEANGIAFRPMMYPVLSENIEMFKEMGYELVRVKVTRTGRARR